MSSKVDVLPLVPSPSGLQVYGAKDGIDYRVPVGAPLGLPYLDVTGKIPSALLPESAPGGGEGPSGQTVEEHVAEADPHPQYTTAAEAAAAAPVQTVAGRSGAVVLVATDISNASATGISLIIAADAAAGRTALSLGDSAVLNIGATAGTVCAGDDSRLSDARTPVAHTHALADITQSGATTGQVPTWNGSAWAPADAGGAPAGSGTELQYRNGSALGAAAGTAWDSANGRLSIGAGASPAGTLHVQAGGAAVVPMIVQGAASQTAALQEWRNSAGTVVASVTAAGSFSVPSNGDIRAASNGFYLNVGATNCARVQSDAFYAYFKLITPIISGATLSPSNGLAISGGTPNADQVVGATSITGVNANPSSTSNIAGGHVAIVGGAGASSSAGAAHGGALNLDGGRAYGTGTDGNVVIGATRGHLKMADARNIQTGTTTGTKIGTDTTQKLAFWNATPVVQPVAVADATDNPSAITQLNDLLAKLRTVGLIAN